MVAVEKNEKNMNGNKRQLNMWMHKPTIYDNLIQGML